MGERSRSDTEGRGFARGQLELEIRSFRYGVHCGKAKSDVKSDNCLELPGSGKKAQVERIGAVCEDCGRVPISCPRGYGSRGAIRVRHASEVAVFVSGGPARTSERRLSWMVEKFGHLRRPTRHRRRTPTTCPVVRGSVGEDAYLAGLRQTDTWLSLSLVKGLPSQSALRSSNDIPANWAIRSHSAGQIYRKLLNP